jgi:hypothetical protein
MAEPISEPTIVPISPAVAEAMNEGVHKDEEAPSAREQDQTAGQNRSLKAARDAETAAAVPPQPDSQPKDGQRPFTLRDIRIGNNDGRGVPITQIYAAESGKYAIYQAGEVMVHFADDPEIEQAQRKAILTVSSARAEVNALVQGLPCREICDRQIAYALQLALDDDIEGAKGTVAAAKAFVLARRAARGRFQYLKWSCGVAAVLIGLLFVASRFYPFQEASSNLWLAAKAGLVGAVFSISLAIRAERSPSIPICWTM